MFGIDKNIIWAIAITWCLATVTDYYLSTGNLLQSFIYTGLVSIVVWTGALGVMYLLYWISERENGKKTL